MNRVIPQDQSFQSVAMDADVQMVEEVCDVAAGPVETATDMAAVGNNVPHPGGRSGGPGAQPGTSSGSSRSRQRLLHFSVHHQDRIAQLEIPDTGTVGKQMGLKWWVGLFHIT